VADLDDLLRTGGTGKGHRDGKWNELRCELHVHSPMGLMVTTALVTPNTSFCVRAKGTTNCRLSKGVNVGRQG
jgi:hypothetical protein